MAMVLADTLLIFIAASLTKPIQPVLDTFTARTLWPEDFRLDRNAPARAIPSDSEALRSLVRARPGGGAREPFDAIVLWERTPGAARRWDGAPLLAAMLNGAQGDDDEAHAGHFALVTGYVGPDGAIGDCITNNFYTLDAESEKGILPAPVPLDNYLADLNSGQAWYRPSYLVVAVLKRERVARATIESHPPGQHRAGIPRRSLGSSQPTHARRTGGHPLRISGDSI